MKDKILLGLAGLVLLIIAASGVVFLKNNLKPQSFGVYSGESFNTINKVTHTATTTAAAGQLPVQLMTTNTGRVYGHIQNNSAVPLYIYFASFDDASAASTTVGITTGIYVAATGGSYEILPENLYTGAVWASSTINGAQIFVTER